MKTQLLIIAAMSLVGTAGFAQGRGSSSSPARSTRATKLVAQNVLPTSQQQPSSAAGASTASLATVAPAPEKKFTFTLMNYTSVNKESLQNNEAAPAGFNRIQGIYHLSATKSIIAREDAGFSYDSKTKASEFHVVDPFIGYTDTKFATLPMDWVITIQPRLYLPLGEKGRFVTKTLGSEALLILADKSLGKFDFEFVGYFQYFNNTQDYAWDWSADSKAFVAKGNPDWSGFVEGEVAYNLTPKLSLIHDVYLTGDATRATPVSAAKMVNKITNETLISYQFTKEFNLKAAVENNATLDSQNAANFYQDKDISYNLYLKLTL